MVGLVFCIFDGSVFHTQHSILKHCIVVILGYRKEKRKLNFQLPFVVCNSCIEYSRVRSWELLHALLTVFSK